MYTRLVFAKQYDHNGSAALIEGKHWCMNAPFRPEYTVNVAA